MTLGSSILHNSVLRGLQSDADATRILNTPPPSSTAIAPLNSFDDHTAASSVLVGAEAPQAGPAGANAIAARDRTAEVGK